jgi:hypothetical protein
MTVWRPDVVRLRLPEIRASFKPKEWAGLQRVRVAVGASTTYVDVVIVGEPTCHGARRRWLLCPRCKKRTSIIGCDFAAGWGCKGCLRWRSRPTPNIAPHVACAEPKVTALDCDRRSAEEGVP